VTRRSPIAAAVSSFLHGPNCAGCLRRPFEAARDRNMILGLCALDMIARLNPGRVVETLQAAAMCDLVVSTLAMGLARPACCVELDLNQSYPALGNVTFS